MNRKKNDRGMIMIESLLVFVVTLALLFLILALTFALYQRYTVGVIANDTAAKVAQNIRVTSTANINNQGFLNVEPYDDPEDYRYLFNSKKENLVSNAKTFGKEFALRRLTKSSYKTAIKLDKTNVLVDVVTDSIGRSHVEVCIDGEYKIFFEEMFDYFGLTDGFTKYKVYGYAECRDLLETLNEVRFIKNAAGAVVDDLGNFGSTASAVMEAIGKIINTVKYFLDK